MKDSRRPYRYCGRDFSGPQLQKIRQIIASDDRPNRAKISRRVCDAFGWYKQDGGLKEMSCRVALLRMERDGLIRLPPPEKGNGNRTARVRISSASDPQPEVCVGAGALGPLRLELVVKGTDSQLWNELIERYHYLGCKPLPGAQLRYFVYSGSRLLATLGFGASAWSVAGRDRYIGWTAKQRQSNLHLIVNNARFLILPWIQSRNLASKILSLACKQIRQDWHTRYNYRPVLMETFVEINRFTGTCYRAANWRQVGTTQGRGKLEKSMQGKLPKKYVLLYPLVKDFKEQLCC
ncbi:MAG: DUF4338 domain-containing protein [Planctomycetes bacterium]|nr:DUF4338 domain-containing protein [Planctomycetota bacterium]